MALSLLGLYDLLARLGAFRHPDVASDDSSLGQCDAAEHRCVAIDDDIVLEDGVSRHTFNGVAVVIERETLRTKRDTLVQLDVVPYDTGRPDDHTRAVVDGEVMTYLGARVNVDARLAVGHLCNDAGYEGNAKEQELVGNAIARDSLDDGIATDDFSERLGSRVTVVGGFDVGGKDAPQLRQPPDELGSHLLRSFRKTTGFHWFASLKAETSQDLLREKVVESVQTHADVIGKRLPAEQRLTVETREDNGPAEIDGFG